MPHRVYKRVNAVLSDKVEKQVNELLEAKSEILRLRAQMRRLGEKRDVSKIQRGASSGSSSEMPLYERAPTSIFGHHTVLALTLFRSSRWHSQKWQFAPDEFELERRLWIIPPEVVKQLATISTALNEIGYPKV